MDNDKERASTITKPSGNVRAGLQPSQYVDINFSKNGTIPAPRNEMYNVVYAETKIDFSSVAGFTAKLAFTYSHTVPS